LHKKWNAKKQEIPKTKLARIEKKLLELEEACEVFMDKISKRLLNLEETTNVCLKKLEQVQEMCTTTKSSCEKLPNQRNNPHSYAEAFSIPSSKEQWQVEHDVRRKSRPKALLIGTSNVKRILVDKLTPVANIEKVIRYTLKETTDYILSCNEQPNIVVLHSLTNDLTKMEPLVCVKNLETLVEAVKHKWENAAMIISMTTPRADDILHQTNGQIINALIAPIGISPNAIKIEPPHNATRRFGQTNAANV
jgi:hypothetical protein